MMLIALMMRPWMCLMHSMHVVPRTLADDLLIIAAGPQHLEHIIEATAATHTFLEKMGARVATHKSIVFASNTTTRQHLRKHKWPYSENVIDMLNSFRDLGAHINITPSIHTTTINQRFRDAIRGILAISRLPLTNEQKCKIIRTSSFPRPSTALRFPMSTNLCRESSRLASKMRSRTTPTTKMLT